MLSIHLLGDQLTDTDLLCVGQAHQCAGRLFKLAANLLDDFPQQVE